MIDTLCPAASNARASCHTRRSKGTGWFSTMMHTPGRESRFIKNSQENAAHMRFGESSRPRQRNYSSGRESYWSPYQYTLLRRLVLNSTRLRFRNPRIEMFLAPTLSRICQILQHTASRVERARCFRLPAELHRLQRRIYRLDSGGERPGESGSLITEWNTSTSEGTSSDVRSGSRIMQVGRIAVEVAQSALSLGEDRSGPECNIEWRWSPPSIITKSGYRSSVIEIAKKRSRKAHPSPAAS